MFICPEGVEYKRKFFKWDAINTIGIAVNKTGVPSVIFKTVYVSLAKYNKPVQIVSIHRYYYDNQYNRVPSNVELETDEDYIIKVCFNRRLIQHILAYWDSDIKNLNDTIGWKSYMKLYNMLHKQSKN